jgi:hypothetical protein
MTPSQARNAIKKCLKALIDPKPNKEAKERIWSYFENNCAYCGKALTKASRNGHIDHLYSEMDGGSNKLSNLVLTCAICNGDEKRESNWEVFLAEKCGTDSKLSKVRANKIRQWININGGEPMLSEKQEHILASEFTRINRVLTESVERLRDVKM